jgi:hypothetical protein
MKRALEALFREARELERRRRRRYAVFALLAAAAIAALAYGAAGSGGGQSHTRASGGTPPPGAVAGGHVVTEASFSKGDTYDAITRVGTRLILSGQVVDRNGVNACHSAVLNPTTLALSKARSGNCDDPALAGEQVLPIITGEPKVAFAGGGTGIGTETVRISHLTADARGYHVGPVVMSFPQISTEHAGWAYGDGYLWIYDGTTLQGSELLRISLTNGAVLQRIPMPDLPRLILAADDDGLWMAPAVNGGGSAVYHVAPGASAATPVFRLQRSYASWMVAAGHNVWLNVGSGSKTETLWRLVGADATRTLHVTLRTSATNNEVEAQGGGAAVVGDASDGLWTAVPPLSGNEQRIVTINPTSGKLTNVAVITPGYASPNAVAYGTWEAVTFDGSMFLLDPPGYSGTYPYAPTGFSALYRVTPPRAGTSGAATSGASGTSGSLPSS